MAFYSWVWLFGAVCGAVLTLYVVFSLIARKGGAQHPATFYVNIVIKNKQQVLQSQVEAKIRGPHRANLIGKAAGKLANLSVSEEDFSRKIGMALCDSIPQSLRENGIRATARVAFNRDSLVVIEVQIPSVDLVRVMGRGDAAREGAVARLLRALDSVAARGAAERAFAAKVAGALSQRLPAQVAARMGERGLDIDVSAFAEADQARFFFRLLNPALREAPNLPQIPATAGITPSPAPPAGPHSGQGPGPGEVMTPVAQSPMSRVHAAAQAPPPQQRRAAATSAVFTSQPSAQARHPSSPDGEERRFDGREGPFTYREFVAYYGDQAGVRWAHAARFLDSSSPARTF